VLLNADDYEDARQSRDARFDGRFFVGVLTTGIYCRPVCPVRVPKRENVQLYRTAASAAEAGFRPCLRCCPESSPGTPAWVGASHKVSRALQLIARGALDEGSVESLAMQLSVGPRQLARLFQKHVGASPVAVAQTQRLHFAKKLIDETSLPLAEVCFASGFGSVRRFNAVFQKVYERSPKVLRSRQNKTIARSNEAINIKLTYRPPFNWQAMLAFLKFRAIPGVEYVTNKSYARTIVVDGKAGDFQVTFDDKDNHLNLGINYPDTRHLYHIIERIRLLFDLKADSVELDQFFSRDKLLKTVVKANPGLRVPGCWDGFEVSVRAILGQQVTVKAASTLVARVAVKHGAEYKGSIPELTHTFPDAATIKRSDLDGIGIVRQRILAIKAVAQMLIDEKIVFDGVMETSEFVKEICAIKGIGDWTAQYIALRAFNDPNAFPYSDLILRRAAAKTGETLTPKQMLLRAESWQPWRAYAVILLWTHYTKTMKP
jgi:AraC family transcriptional regulator, regulatory protein of adaptative response / DNA-3-methyladenine glycosylase II